jgi:hypothetical protein
MTARLGKLALVLLVGALGGCATGSGGAWDATGYTQKTYGWTAQYPKGEPALLDANWRLDNWTRNDDGSYDEKTSGKYTVLVEQDEDRDGRISQGEMHQMPLYDLKFTSATDNGVVWVQTRPVLDWDAQKDLDVLVENFADSLAGTGLYEQGTVYGTTTVKTRSFTTFVKDKQEMKVGPHQGLSAVIEVAESERLRADPAYRSAKIRLVITKFKYRVEVLPASVDSTTNAVVSNAVYEDHTAIMLVGYVNDAQRFDAEVPAFETLVSLLRWPHPMLWHGAKPAAAPPPANDAPAKEPAAPPAETPATDSSPAAS